MSEERLGAPLWAISRNVRRSVLNLGLLLAAFLTVTDVLLVSHYQPATALSILRYTPPLSLLLGVLTNLLPLLLPILALATASLSITYFFSMKISTAMSWLGRAILFCGAALLLVDRDLYPWRWYLLALVGLVIVIILSVMSLRGGDSGTSAFLNFMVVSGALLLIPTLFTSSRLPVAVAQPFLGPEIVSLDDRDSIDATTLVAYVLDEQSGWTTLLLERNRVVHVVKSSEILSRTPCYLPNLDRYRPLITVESWTSQDLAFPTCPSMADAVTSTSRGPSG